MHDTLPAVLYFHHAPPSTLARFTGVGLPRRMGKAMVETRMDDLRHHGMKPDGRTDEIRYRSVATRRRRRKRGDVLDPVFAR